MHRIHRWGSSPLIGYSVTLLLAAAAFSLPWIEQRAEIHDLFLVSPFVIVTLLTGEFWGAGPALLALAFEVPALDYWIVPP